MTDFAAGWGGALGAEPGRAFRAAGQGPSRAPAGPFAQPGCGDGL